MNIYTKETLYVLDYDNNIVDAIFISDDRMTPGYAYDIKIKEANTGYSDLTFNMPNTIINELGEQIKNPKLALLTPLVKLRYKREIYYMGEQPMVVREPIGYGDKTGYQDRTYTNEHPHNLIENYTMDYIVQPIDKKRNTLELTTTFTAIDYPRFNLSKKKVGLTIAKDTTTRPDWSLYKNEPMSQEGVIHYEKWSLQTIGDDVIPLEFNPETDKDYPLTEEQIENIMDRPTIWTYGLLGTAFYWPVVGTARFEGRMYSEGGYLVLHLYDYYNLDGADVEDITLADRYGYEWSYLSKVDSLLCPNRADYYLHHILENTNWKIKQRVGEKGEMEDDVDLVYVDIPNPDGSINSTSSKIKTANLNVSGGNCYNAITALCKALQLYPVFDCENREISLKVFAGKNYGLTYSLGNNLSNNSTKINGEKVITKLYVAGGKTEGQNAGINIGNAARSYTKYLTGFFTSYEELAEKGTTGWWAIVDEDLQDKYWISGENRKVYFRNGEVWTEGTKLENGNWTGVANEMEYIIDPISGMRAPWDPNDQEYIYVRSPYGTNYIINLKWPYQNGWITKEEILELYQTNLLIHEANVVFVDKYIKDQTKTMQDYYNAVTTYDIAQGNYLATWDTMMNTYYYDTGDITKGEFKAFHILPPAKGYSYTTEGTMNYLTIYHCMGETKDGRCGNTKIKSFTKCDKCGSKNIKTYRQPVPYWGQDDKYTTIYSADDYPYSSPYEGPAYDPKKRGDYLRLVTSLDQSNEDWEIDDYEKRVGLGTKIPKTGKTIDGYDYILTDDDGNDVAVRSTVGAIDVWNDDLKDYIGYCGQMIDAQEDMKKYTDKLNALKAKHDEWKAKDDYYHRVIQEKFGDYLVEGNYTNDEQPYVQLLFNEGMEASDKFCTPEITYTLDVVDSSGLIEYRQPQITKYICKQCGYEHNKYVANCPKCGNTILPTYDIYNDLVRMLHSVGQIVPKAGDYTAVYDEPMGMFGVPALITEVERVLDNPLNNRIKLDTGYTDDEELVGNIITATNTVLNNADIYARTAILKGDGTIDTNALKESLDNPTANITLVGTNGSIILDNTGLLATDPTDKTRAMKYSGNGVFKTNNYSDAGAVTWERMMGPSGINADAITAGSINTQNLTITSGKNAKALIDRYGLRVKRSGSKSSRVTKFNADKAKTDDTYTVKWGTDNNIAAFIGVDTANQPLAYINGYLVATEGSNIAGWITDTNKLYKDKAGMASTGDYAFWAGDPEPSKANFYVKHDGTFYSKVVADDIDGVNKSITTEISNREKGDNALSSRISQTINSITLSVTGGGDSNTAKITIGATREDGSSVSIGAQNITFNGLVRFTNLSTSGSTTINGDNITTGKVKAGCIDADNLKVKAANITGTLTASQINTSGLTVSAANVTGSFSASKISGGTLSLTSGNLTTAVSGSGIKISNSYKYNGATIGTVFEVSLYGDEPGCIVDLDGYSYIESNWGYMSIHGNGIALCPGGDVTLQGYTIGSGSTVFKGKGGAQMWANEHCAFKPASGKKANVQDTSGSNHAIKTDGGDLSSRNIKTNFTNLTSVEEQILQEFNQIGTYHFDYKYKESSFEKDDDYGFVIDELEEQPLLSKIFLHSEEKLQIRKDNVLVNLDEPDATLPSITVKRWNSESYIKGLFILVKALHNKIQVLEEQIKKEKE